MAHDYLAIQGAAIPSERAFSSGGLTGTSHHSHLKPDIFKALQLLKSGYRNGHISAAEEAGVHASWMALFEEFTYHSDVNMISNK